MEKEDLTRFGAPKSPLQSSFYNLLYRVLCSIVESWNFCRLRHFQRLPPGCDLCVYNYHITYRINIRFIP